MYGEYVLISMISQGYMVIYLVVATFIGMLNINSGMAAGMFYEMLEILHCKLMG
ncbi:hypothetical protein KAM644c_45890 [Klebsiella quasipneumoniae subsp. quasipneumoniae]|uniref:Uncharacterized protein n=1 Tax=Klebsiella quasipneumoniae subsp. quasipneumoniae TaxID=1667327 RepID=A0AAN1Y9N0_9ENTR|nr:hypothetical protein KAM622c_47450 [Klebsiella quasipneumoniae subsp. quasipneumoniae]BDO15523.1 hypothetical protein KAM644c_45890 [Klebsiella quasipneumoniae subsp. quasipneumoniae]BDO21495.1 hypothetical protein KAM645c_45850 [Klebsiella quasipneumoniae subsp. quasipneumoniae]